MSFSNRIKAARESKSLSQEALANMLGVTDGTISSYEKGTSFPRWDKIIKLCDILDIDPNYMFWDDLPDKIREKIKKDSAIVGEPPNSNEQKLLSDFRDMSPQGQEYLLQTSDMAKDKYKKDSNITNMEEVG